MDGGAWKAAVHGVTEGWTRLSYFTFTFHFHALEKEMATHSSVLAWRIPVMGEPSGLPSMGSHRVRHDWSDLAAHYICQDHENAKWFTWCHEVCTAYFLVLDVLYSIHTMMFYSSVPLLMTIFQFECFSLPSSLGNHYSFLKTSPTR